MNLKSQTKSLTTNEAYKWMAELGEQSDIAQHKEVAKYLTSSIPFLRLRALNTLVLHWGLKEYEDKCKELINDENPEVAALAVSCLNALSTNDLENSANTQKLFCELTLNKSKHWLVRASAYDVLLKQAKVPLKDIPFFHDEEDLNRKIDIKLVKHLCNND